MADGKVTTLVEGADFYSNPRVSPDGRQLAWLAWNHPNMPWDDTELFVAPFEANGSLGKPRKVAGDLEESIFQPEWSPDGTLYFVSDRTDWWNLYAERDGKIVPVLPMEAEFGAPQWVFGTTTYGFEPDGHIVARYTTRRHVAGHAHRSANRASTKRSTCRTRTFPASERRRRTRVCNGRRAGRSRSAGRDRFAPAARRT